MLRRSLPDEIFANHQARKRRKLNRMIRQHCISLLVQCTLYDIHVYFADHDSVLLLSIQMRSNFPESCYHVSCDNTVSILLHGSRDETRLK